MRTENLKRHLFWARNEARKTAFFVVFLAFSCLSPSGSAPISFAKNKEKSVIFAFRPHPTKHPPK